MEPETRSRACRDRTSFLLATGVQSVVQAQVLNILLRGRKMGKKGANGGSAEIQPTFRRRNGLSGREHLADSSK